jgi:hypothetical protein
MILQDAIDARIAQIRGDADASDSQFDKEKAAERIASLGGGIGRIRVRENPIFSNAHFAFTREAGLT